MKILLASNSPRRKELLQNLGFGFEVVSVDCDEIYPKELEVEDIAGFLSELKANAFRHLVDEEVLITADTIVALDGNILGKPKTDCEAKEMLERKKTICVSLALCYQINQNTLSLGLATL